LVVGDVRALRNDVRLHGNAAAAPAAAAAAVWSVAVRLILPHHDRCSRTDVALPLPTPARPPARLELIPRR